jgi:hypothetical protein
MTYFGHFRHNLSNIWAKTLQFVPFRKDFHEDSLKLGNFEGLRLPSDGAVVRDIDTSTTMSVYYYYSMMVYQPTAAVIL